MKLSLAYSPCPNDTFIFGALINGLIDTEDLEFEVFLEDVESLNIAASKQKYAITKLSFGMFKNVMVNYFLLSSGAALGKGCGPLLIAREPLADLKPTVDYRVLIPGKNTTANFLLELFYPNLKNKQEALFSEIQPALMQGKTDLGLIIHESRFTYLNKGLFKVADLGDLWEQLTSLPIPLGGIFASRALPEAILRKINRLIKKSIEFAFDYPEKIMPYVKLHANEMDEWVMMQHIELYVNKYSLNLGNDGIESVRYLLNKTDKENSQMLKNSNWLIEN